MKSILSVLALCTLVVPASAQAEESPTPAEVVAGVVAAAESLARSLDPAQQEALLFEFSDNEQKRRWSNLPAGSFPRRGLRMGDLTDEQKEAVHTLIKATLSEDGYQQVLDNLDAEELLGQRGRRSRFSKDEFYVSLVGQPSTTAPWMWQFGGHHLGLNATIVGDQITLSPTLTGGQPAKFEKDGREVRLLGEERDLAFALLGSLNEEQRKTAVVSEKRANLAFGPRAEDITPKTEGLKADQLDDTQRALLLKLIEARVGILNDTHAGIAMRAIREHLDETWFAWFGPTDEDGAADYRIQGPTVIIEYALQNLGGDPTNHIHAIYRDPTNDYGKRWLTGP